MKCSDKIAKAETAAWNAALDAAVIAVLATNQYYRAGIAAIENLRRTSQ